MRANEEGGSSGINGGDAPAAPNAAHAVPRRAVRALTAVGLCLIVAAFLLALFNLAMSERAGAAAADVLAQLDAAIGECVRREEDSGAAQAWQLDRDMPTIEVADAAYLGIVSVPSLDIELAVAAAWDNEALGSCACRYSGSYYTDDLVIGGSSYASHFGSLTGVQIGADVYLTNVDGRRVHYVVSNRETLRGDAFDELADNNKNSSSSSDWDLTLFTSDLDGFTRCAVRCVRE